MSIEELIVHFSEYQGKKLVDFSEVALPIYRITSTILVHEKVELDTIEEFILRSVSLGFDDIEGISELLGLSLDVTKEGLTQLIRADLLQELVNGYVVLTPHGQESVKNHSKVRPEEQQIVFDFDGLIRKVRLSRDNDYLSPKQVTAAGLVEIRAIPNRKPEEGEIELQQVNDYICGHKGTTQSDKTLLRIRRITRAVRLFYKAIMFVYKEHGSGKYEAAFCIENQLSDQHRLSFIAGDGLNRLGLLKNMNDYPPSVFAADFPDFVSFSTQTKHNGANIQYKSRKKSKATDSNYMHPLLSDYPKYLSDALERTESNLVILSTFVSSKVINQEFYKTILKLLDIGVTIHVGYKDDSTILNDHSWKGLKDLSKSEKKFTLREIPSLNSCAIVKDLDYYVISNFDFLSYKGNPDKKLKDTCGNYNDDSKKVSDFYDLVLKKYFAQA